jgi:hypothetical protein
LVETFETGIIKTANQQEVSGTALHDVRSESQREWTLVKVPWEGVA